MKSSPIKSKVFHPNRHSTPSIYPHWLKIIIVSLRQGCFQLKLIRWIRSILIWYKINWFMLKITISILLIFRCMNGLSAWKFHLFRLFQWLPKNVLGLFLRGFLSAWLPCPGVLPLHLQCVTKRNPFSFILRNSTFDKILIKRENHFQKLTEDFLLILIWPFKDLSLGASLKEMGSDYKSKYRKIVWWRWNIFRKRNGRYFEWYKIILNNGETKKLQHFFWGRLFRTYWRVFYCDH